MRPRTFLAVVAAPIALAAPAPIPDSLPKPRTLAHGALAIGNLSSIIPAVFTDPAGIMHSAGAVAQAIAAGTISGTDVGVMIKKLFSAARPTAVPASISQAREWAAGVWGVSDPATSPKPPENIIANALNLIHSGFTNRDVQSVVSGTVSVAIPH
ncbi:hypothetical protein DSL72_005936 [Monilinia vaccinii-corymbosi]|uniref:Uncharacterized protein n=1 Tax=Monilinia vaccinii-corymbosi TaxID=61207 RepID=A0A8A3PH30_9HELO|nr:hypothetical protein DSL72_005936 [Monilinia vaccinii-corymbosi]